MFPYDLVEAKDEVDNNIDICSDVGHEINCCSSLE